MGQQDPFDAARISLRCSSLEEGLPGATVYALTLDVKGRLWAGTQEGAAYLGGRGWIPFSLPQEASSQSVRALVQSSDGTFWFGTEDGGLWNLKEGRWTHFEGGRELPSQRINSLLETFDDKGRRVLWVGTGNGLARWVEGHWQTVPIPSDVLDPWIWSVNEYRDSDGSKRLWVGSQDGLATFAHGKWARMGPGEGWRLGGVNAFAEMEDPGGGRTVWATCWGNGVARWDGKVWTYFGKQAGLPGLNPTSLAVAREVDGSQTLWAGFFDAGLALFRKGRWTSLPLSPNQPQGIYALLPNPALKPCLWAGMRSGGVMALDPTGWRTLDLDSGLPSAQATCFLDQEVPGGTSVFWVGTVQGLSWWEAGRFHTDGLEEGLPHLFIINLCLFPGPQGPELWCATLRGVARREGRRWHAFGPAEGLPQNQTIALLASRDPDGTSVLLAGTTAGLARFRDGRWQLITVADGLPGNIVVALHESQDLQGKRSLWVGTRGNGVGRFRDGKWTAFGTKSGLANLSVYAFEETHSTGGRRWLWAATSGGGLARLDLDHEETPWETWDSKRLPALPSNTIRHLTLDRAGRLYLSTTRGIARLDLNGPQGSPSAVATFTPGDGLPSAATVLGASYRDLRGRIWVGTASGVGILDPNLEGHPLGPAPLILEGAFIEGREVPATFPLRLGFRQKRLAFEYALGTFHRREDIRYQTQLVGLEQGPGDWRPQGSSEFTGLSSGRYVLRIWGKDFEGKVAGPLEVPFEIEPPPWLRWWAYIFYGVVLLGGGVLTHQLRTKLLLERNRALEALVGARTAELGQANEALRSQSLTDPLTGLSNRRFVDSSMGEVVARILRRYTNEGLDPRDPRARNRDLVFLMMDIDFFKSVNDEFGHQAGDLVLCQAAAILRNAVREGDRVVRWGGEEFLVLGIDTILSEAPVLAERIRSKFEGHVFDIGEGRTIHKTCSIGFACFPVIHRDPACFGWEQVLDLADQCLYEAKEGGRDQWVGILPMDEAEPALSFHPATMKVQELVEQGLAIRKVGP